MSKYKGLYTLTLLTSILGFSQQNYTTSSKHSSTMNSSQSSNYKTSNMITPNASPIVEGGADLFVTADFIYWTAREAGLNFATLNYIPNTITAGDNQTFTSSKLLNANNKYSPGFKVGLGLIMDHDGWDLFLEYTWFRTKLNSKTYEGDSTQNSAPNLQPVYHLSTVPPFNFVPSANSTTSRDQWRFRFNDFNLELGRNFYVSHYLTLRPHAGLKGGWQRQDFKIYWTFDDIVFPLGTYTSAEYTTKLRQKMWDIGLRAGLDSSWFLTKNFSFFGDFALSGVWTQFTVNHADVATTSGSTDPTENAENFQTINQRAQFHTIVPVIELMLGARFDWSFSDDHYRIRLQAGWENQVWFTQNNFSITYPRPLLNSTNNTQLTLQGLTAEIRFDF